MTISPKAREEIRHFVYNNLREGPIEIRHLEKYIVHGRRITEKELLLFMDGPLAADLARCLVVKDELEAYCPHCGDRLDLAWEPCDEYRSYLGNECFGCDPLEARHYVIIVLIMIFLAYVILGAK